MPALFRQKFCFVSFLLLFLFFESWGYAQGVIEPRCYGGNRLLREFIAEEIVYPDQALQAKIEGVVELSFIVMPDASINELTVIKKVSPEVDAEAIRIFKKILWYPATELGKPIAYLHQMSFSFKIKKYQKIIRRRGYEYFNYPHQPIDTSNCVCRRKQVDKEAYPIISSIDRSLSGFLSGNLKYPESAFKQSISGTVKLLFVVEPSGRISNIEVKEFVGAGCTEEAIRVVRLIRWFPALKDDVAVRSFVPIEIKFNLALKTVGGSVPSPGQLY